MENETLKSKEAQALELIEFLARGNNSEEDDGGEGMTDPQFMGFMEAILIILEKCQTKEEFSEAMKRILARVEASVEEE